MVTVFLAEGFEEIEALGTLDLLRRAGIEAKSVSISEKNEVVGSHGISVIADMTAAELTDAPEMIILPGGMPGTLNLEKSDFVRGQIKSCVDEKRYLAAICAAPSILGKMNLLDSGCATCYPGFEEYLGNLYTKCRVCVSGNIITSAGPGTFFDFSYEIIKLLRGAQTADKVLKSSLFKD